MEKFKCDLCGKKVNSIMKHKAEKWCMRCYVEELDKDEILLLFHKRTCKCGGEFYARGDLFEIACPYCLRKLDSEFRESE